MTLRNRPVFGNDSDFWKLAVIYWGYRDIQEKLFRQLIHKLYTNCPLCFIVPDKLCIRYEDISYQHMNQTLIQIKTLPENLSERTAQSSDFFATVIGVHSHTEVPDCSWPNPLQGEWCSTIYPHTMAQSAGWNWVSCSCGYDSTLFHFLHDRSP